MFRQVEGEKRSLTSLGRPQTPSHPSRHPKVKKTSWGGGGGLADRWRAGPQTEGDLVVGSHSAKVECNHNYARGGQGLPQPRGGW